jgi:hypothetical protein
MIALKATGFPEDFEFKEAARDMWSVFYFTSLSDARTRITIVGLGYNDSEQSQKMLAFFKPANKYTMDQLSAAMKKKHSSKEK